MKTIIIVLLTIMLSFSFSSNGNCKSTRGLYLYTAKEISQFLKNIGYSNYNEPKYSCVVMRNSDGTALEFLRNDRKRMLIVTLGGLIKEINLPKYPTGNIPNIWLNKDLELVAWDEREIIRYNTIIDKQKISWEDVVDTPFGIYFPKRVKLKKYYGTVICSIENPEKVLAGTNINAPKIFIKDNMIYLFGSCYYEDPDRFESEVLIFRKENQSLQFMNRIAFYQTILTQVFFVHDLCPWADEALFIKNRDHLPGSWYKVNLKTLKKEHLGLIYSKGAGFYLQGDIINEVTKK